LRVFLAMPSLIFLICTFQEILTYLLEKEINEIMLHFSCEGGKKGGYHCFLKAIAQN
jgi:hypothetical protein